MARSFDFGFPFIFEFWCFVDLLIVVWRDWPGHQMLIILTDISSRFFPDCILIASRGGKTWKCFHVSWLRAPKPLQADSQRWDFWKGEERTAVLPLTEVGLSGSYFSNIFILACACFSFFFSFNPTGGRVDAHAWWRRRTQVIFKFDWKFN